MLRIDDELIIRKNGLEKARLRITRKTEGCRRYCVFIKIPDVLSWTGLFEGNLSESRRYVDFAVSVYKESMKRRRY